MKIAFVGDSYCADIGENGVRYRRDTTDTDINSWPHLLKTEYNADIICSGKPGGALYHSYKDLLKVIDIADYIIFCITDSYRLANRHSAPMNTDLPNKDFAYQTRALEEHFPDKKKQIEFMEAATAYYKNIMSIGYHNIAHKGIIMQIDQLMIEKKKKCIWFSCFKHSMRGYIPKSGPYGDRWLKQFNTDTYPQANHFNQQNNNNMATLLSDIIKNNSFMPRMIEMKNYFEILK